MGAQPLGMRTETTNSISFKVGTSRFLPLLIAPLFLCVLAAEDIDKRIGVLIEKAESGDAEAQLKLSFAYSKGEGVPKNESEANRLLLKSAENGCAWAQWVMYSYMIVGFLIKSQTPHTPNLLSNTKKKLQNG
jgi:hypothetical protein